LRRGWHGKVRRVVADGWKRVITMYIIYWLRIMSCIGCSDTHVDVMDFSLVALMDSSVLSELIYPLIFEYNILK
jgi:hypothetical protein